MKGFIGIDEVGRGPLAGPVTVCAFYLESEEYIISDIFNGKLKDSKKLNSKRREEIFKMVKKGKFIFSISSRQASYIDKNGIVRAINSCIMQSLKGLEKKGVDIYKTKIRLDGGLKLNNEFNYSTYIKGDEKFLEIALASICAKVTRDKYMIGLSKKLPEYFWSDNVGYGTKKHREAIKEYGFTKYHRRTFLKNLINQ